VSVQPLVKTFDGTAAAAPGVVTFGGLRHDDFLIPGIDYTVRAEFTGGDYNAGDNKTYMYTITMLNTNNANRFTLPVNTISRADGAINKANGLDMIMPPPDIRLFSCETDPVTFELDNIALNRSDYGIRSYSLGAFVGGLVNIFTDMPALSGPRGNYFTWRGAGESSGSATQVIILTTTNYEDIVITLNFQATQRTDVSAHITFNDGSAVYNRTGLTHETATINQTAFTPSTNPAWTYVYAPALGSPGASLQNGLPFTVGSYDVIASYEDDNNFGSVTATFTVDPAVLTVINIVVADKPFDGANTAVLTSASLGGVIPGDNVTLENGTPVFTGVDIGNGIEIIFTTPFSLTGPDAANYTLGPNGRPGGVTANITAGFSPAKDIHYTITALNMATPHMHGA
jgi:hypothetical protein